MANPGVTPLMEWGKSNCRIRVPYVREAIGEFFGTLILCFMCVGAVATHTMKHKILFEDESQIVPVFGIILGIMIATVMNGGVSGAHINPAVTISLAVAGDLSWYSVPGYVISQFLGAIVGALLGYSLVEPMLWEAFVIEKNLRSKYDSLPEADVGEDFKIASMFSPLRSGFTVGNGIATEAVLTCLLMMTVCAAVDKQSSFKPPKYLLAIIFPLVIAGFAFCHDMPSATLLNPARDLGPRVAAWILGWDSDYVFKSKDWNGNVQHWWLVGLLGPLLGGVLGSLIYSIVIGPQMNIAHLDESTSVVPKPTVAESRPEAGGWKTSFASRPQVSGVPTIPPQDYNEYEPPNINNSVGGRFPPLPHVGVNNQGFNKGY